MGSTLSVNLLDCFVNKIGKDVLIPLEPKFYCRYVGDIYNKRNKNQPDKLFERMSKYYPNINLTVEVNPSKCLDTKTHRDNNEIKCFSYHKEMKLPFHWTSAVPKHYKKNVIIGDLHCVNNLSSNFAQEVGIIRNKYIKVGYPFGFINSIIDGFNQEKEDTLMPTSLLEERKEVTSKFLSANETKTRFLILLTNWKCLLTTN